ncbi:MAG: dehypoxanthine futalosine cyclase [Nitrospinae bacterium]|nr:dehypoxanthine futalosine cyclase [Nitrospinota bacterium]
MSGSPRSVIERTVAGARLSDDEAHRLLACDDILSLGQGAQAVRMKKHPDPTVTYIIDRNINYTNICTSGCTFCAFWRPEGDPEGYVICDDDLDAKIVETQALGGNQILLQGGLHPGLPLSWYEDLLRRIKERHGVHIHAFSGPEIVHFAQLAGLTVEEVLARLKDAGLDSIPGGGAEILSDRVRAEVSPHKCSADQWIDVMRAAHRQGLRTTATMMFGHKETLGERVESMRRIRDLQDETGGFTAFIPWPFQPDHTVMAGLERSGAFDYLRTLAVARLYLDNIDNLQASWVTQGAKIAQLSLFFGANDMGSTMIEENVVAAAGVSFRLSEKDIRQIVTDAGFVPRRRTMAYELLPE